jgi:hypothetical protein
MAHPGWYERGVRALPGFYVVLLLAGCTSHSRHHEQGLSGSADPDAGEQRDAATGKPDASQLDASEPDADVDIDADTPGAVTCGTRVCAPGVPCCNNHCLAPDEQCEMLPMVYCDGPEDCPAGERCMLFKEGLACAESGGYQTFCHADTDCEGVLCYAIGTPCSVCTDGVCSAPDAPTRPDNALSRPD